MATKRRRFTAEFKADGGAARRAHDSRPSTVHPNQVTGWKRQAQEGLRRCSSGTNRREADHETIVHDLHAKIGELTVERDFLSRGLGS